MIKYINMNSGQGVETIDQLSLDDFTNMKELKTECRRLVSEYRIAGYGNVYISSRSTKQWRNK